MRILYFLMCWSIASGVFSQNFHLSHYTTSDGLPAKQIYHAAADPLGFIWLATRKGLVRFDGIQFESYSQIVPSQHGKFLLPYQQSLLLSHDAGISRITPGVDSAEIELLHAASIDPNDSLLYYPDEMIRTSNATLWIARGDGVVVQVVGDQVKKYGTSEKGVATYFTQSKDGLLYSLTSKGLLSYYNETEDRFEKLSQLPAANCLLWKENTLWIGGKNLHQLRLHSSGKRILRSSVHRNTEGTVSCIANGPSGELLLGISQKGIYQVSQSNGTTLVFNPLFSNNDPHRIDRLPFKNVHRIINFKQKNLLICSDEGFGILRNRFFESVNGLPQGNTNTIASFGADRIYVNSGDLYRIDLAVGRYTSTPLPDSKNGNINSIASTAEHLWMGTANGKLIKANLDANPLRILDFSERGEGIFYLLSDSKNRLWMCQAPTSKPIAGLACLQKNGSFVEYGPEKGLDDRILVIKESTKGRLYAGGIGKYNYLYRYLPEKDAFLNISLPLNFYVSPNFEVHDLTIDDQGIIWLATTDGLLRYDLDRVEQIPLFPANQSVEIRAVQHLSDGSIWCATDTKGVIRYHDNEFISLSEQSGLPSKIMAYRSLIKDEKDRLWIGTAEGMVYSFDTLPKPATSAPPQLAAIQVDGEPYTKRPIELYQDQSLVLKVNSPAFHGYRTFYQYQIDSTYWSTENVVSEYNFEQLDLGKYSVAVRAKQEGGFFPSEALEIPLQVKLRWYQQPWLRYGFSLGVLLPLFLVWFYRRRRYTAVISNLSKELNLNKARIRRRDKALAKAKAEIDQDHRELRVSILSLNLLESIIRKIAPGTKWDVVLEELSIDLLRLPGVIAYEIAHVEQKYLHFEGYSDLIKGFTNARIPNNPKENLVAYSLKIDKPMLFKNLRAAEADYLLEPGKGKNAHQIQAYKSAVFAPFDWKSKPAVLILYSDKEDFFDRYNLKTTVVLANYLEQIAKT